MQAVVDLIISNDRVAPSPDLHPSQRVAMDIVLLQHATPISEEVHAPLQSSVDLVVLEGWVAFTCDPHSSICVGVDLVLDELTTSLCIGTGKGSAHSQNVLAPCTTELKSGLKFLLSLELSCP